MRECIARNFTVLEDGRIRYNTHHWRTILTKSEPIVYFESPEELEEWASMLYGTRDYTSLGYQIHFTRALVPNNRCVVMTVGPADAAETAPR